MLRNHPSLALWVGGNEARPLTILTKRFRDMIGSLNPETAYVSYSTSYEGFGQDGPYGIQHPRAFTICLVRGIEPYCVQPGVWIGRRAGRRIDPVFHERRRRKRFPVDITQETFLTKLNQTWLNHCYIPFFNGPNFADQLELYGRPSSLDEFCEQAQAAQYQQYKSLFEGLNAHMWIPYTGGNIWKAQAGWTSMRGFLYDKDLEPTGGLFGVRSAAEPLHVQLNLATLDIQVVNNTGSPLTGASVRQVVCGSDGRVIPDRTRTFAIPDIPATSTVNVGTLSGQIDRAALHVVKLCLLDGPSRPARTLRKRELGR